MAFKREDLVRVWEEFSAPEGIFLKRGSQLHVERRSGFPFFGVVRTPDPAPDRLYFGKSYIYPLFAAPFVRIFGTSGFLVFHSLLLALCVAAGYSFLVARGSRPTAAAAFAAVFIFGSIAPVYFFWLTPEFFNLTLVFLAVFLWAYKLAEAPPVRSGRLAAVPDVAGVRLPGGGAPRARDVLEADERARRAAVVPVAAVSAALVAGASCSAAVSR